MAVDDRVFKQFLEKNTISKSQHPQNIAQQTNASAMNGAGKGQMQGGYRSRSLDNLDEEKLLSIQDYIEDKVRKASSNNSDIFRNPREINNKNQIIQYINSALKIYKEEFQGVYISPEHEKEIRDKVWDELTGFGPLEPFLSDPNITEVMVINAKKTYIEKAGNLMLSDCKFKDYNHIKRILDRIIAPIGRKIDEQTPIVDARLPQGFRLNAVISPIALAGGAFITIRKFPEKVWTPEDLIRFKSAPRSVFDFLSLCVRARKNICVSGGTGSGKTTLLNVLSNCIPVDERIITIEDTAELKLVGNHILSEEARPANAEGTGAITIRDLVKTALRQRPDRIVVGECRGAEALDMLQAMNTGHDGSMTTGHANSTTDFLKRIEYMCMISGDMPLAAIKPQIASAIGLVVQIGRVRIKGKKCRRMIEICEVLDEFDENGNYILKPIFDSKFKGHGKHEITPTGYLPTFIDELVEDYGFDPHLLDKPAEYIDPEP